MPTDPTERTEYGIIYPGGSVLVRPAEGDRYWPNDEWCRAHLRHGARPTSRRILVLSDWEEVTDDGG